MNKIIAAFLIVALVGACGPEDAIPEEPVTNDNFDPSKSTLLKQGMFEGVGHTASGAVKIYDTNGSKTVYFETFASENGPDLKVYLSKDASASEYIRLGTLKSVNGAQSYAVPGSPDINRYPYVHIWCEKYTVVFAIAQMM